MSANPRQILEQETTPDGEARQSRNAIGADLAVPMLPCRSLRKTVVFYTRLGFTVRLGHTGPDAYAVAERGSLELHFFEMSWLEPEESYAGCYLRVADLDALHRDFAAALKLPDVGVPRLGPIEEKPWGTREFHLVDLDGNLLRAGQPSSSPPRSDASE